MYFKSLVIVSSFVVISYWQRINRCLLVYGSDAFWDWHLWPTALVQVLMVSSAATEVADMRTKVAISLFSIEITTIEITTITTKNTTAMI